MTNKDFSYEHLSDEDIGNINFNFDWSFVEKNKKKTINKSDWNTKCPKCKEPAYIGFNKIECSNNNCK